LLFLQKQLLDDLYVRYNRREIAQEDPVRFLYSYDDARDREIVGLVASSLALGNIRQILASVASAVRQMKPSPAHFLDHASHHDLRQAFAGFKHRFIKGEEVSSMLAGAKRVIGEWGSLGACFAAHLRSDEATILPALVPFVNELRSASNGRQNRLLPLPEKGSACKRLNLFLRWMVRRDEVDLGVWDNIRPAQLIIPLDTHVHRISRMLRLTRRKQADMRTALEITAAFRKIVPDDPVRYDFALAHLGIGGGENLNMFLSYARGRR